MTNYTPHQGKEYRGQLNTGQPVWFLELVDLYRGEQPKGDFIRGAVCHYLASRGVDTDKFMEEKLRAK